MHNQRHTKVIPHTHCSLKMIASDRYDFGIHSRKLAQKAIAGVFFFGIASEFI